MKVPSFLAALSVFSVSFGIASSAHATGNTGAIDFSVPPSPPAATDTTAQAPNPESSQPSSTQLADSKPLSLKPGSVSSTPASDPPNSPNSPPPVAESPNVLDFSPTSPPSSPPPSSSSPLSLPPTSPPPSNIFDGGSNSLVARAVGNAEGTRTPNGSKTSAYYGHTDPGNGVWNLGSFSFQHCRDAQYRCSTPEEADIHQLKRLQEQANKLRQKADAIGINLTLPEELNGIDLANQAPLAALGEPGYVDWLKKAREMGLSNEQATLWARVKSYWDPNLNTWNAPGLGNSESQIKHDQNRRLEAIARALDVYQQQIVASKIAELPKENGKPQQNKEKIADSIIFQDLSN